MKSCLTLLFFCAHVMAQGDSLAKAGDMPGRASLQNNVVQRNNLSKISGDGEKELVNIVVTEKKIRALGWGEYRVGGRCLCCDNMKSVDCITVQTTNRTDRLRIKQIVDGKREADTGDNATFFGDIYEREVPTKPVSQLMAEISLPKLRDIHRILVYGVADSLKKKNVLFNCELGYTDQFDRLQWIKKVENSGNADSIIYNLEKPIFTRTLFLKIKDGRNKLTEVAIFAENKTE